MTDTFFWEIHEVRKGLWAFFLDCAFRMLIGWTGKHWSRGRNKPQKTKSFSDHCTYFYSGIVPNKPRPKHTAKTTTTCSLKKKLNGDTDLICYRLKLCTSYICTVDREYKWKWSLQLWSKQSSCKGSWEKIPRLQRDSEFFLGYSQPSYETALWICM